MKIEQIQTLDLPELEPYRTLRRPQDHIRHGIFVAEGEKVVRRLLTSQLSLVSLLLTPQWLDKLKPFYTFTDVNIYVAEKKLVESIVGYPLHQGIMAVGRVPAEPAIDQVLKTSVRPYLFVALDGIVSAENIGVIVRNSAGFGASAILADHTSASPYLRRAVRNSMGSVFRLPVLHVDLAEHLPELGCTVIGATPDSGISIADADFTKDICIVFGNEGDGISGRVLEKCDLRVAIPMKNETDSLNVASASAVFLYEIARQRLDAQQRLQR